MRGYRTIKYSLFCCCYVFWVSSSVLVAVGVYAKIAKEKGILVVILLLQIAVTVLGYLFTERVIQRTEKLMLRAVVRYREDLDLENVIDFIQKKMEESSAKEEVYIAGCLEKIIRWCKQNLVLVGGLAGALLLVEIYATTHVEEGLSRSMPEKFSWLGLKSQGSRGV
ncbi:hypothetical protein CRUP_030719 [Coryphaenoides rupestris]|nr:hypothetical protein CRUP_030719 [Coryphaenoides rupestris]